MHLHQSTPAPPPGYGHGAPPQPPYGSGRSASPLMAQTWSSGVCDCCRDIPNCCLTCWCPCITFGQIAEIVDNGKTSCGVYGTRYALINVLTGLGCLYSQCNRTNMRRQYGLPELPTNDFCVHFCCGPCALCQEYRELRRLGFDLSIGWQGNMDRGMFTNGVQIPPTSPGGMNR